VERVLGCIASNRLCIIRCKSGFHRAPTLAGVVGDIVASWGTSESIRIVHLSEYVFDLPWPKQEYHIPAMRKDLRAELMQWVGIGPGYYTATNIRDLDRVIDMSLYRSQAGMKEHSTTQTHAHTHLDITKHSARTLHAHTTTCTTT